MISYFRSLRKELFKSGSLAKYLFYAFGEILLVVIGILIALQINNWNERTKQRNEEVRLLEKISIDLNSDINQLQGHISDATFRQTIVDSLITILYKDPNTDPVKFLELNLFAISTENHFEVNTGTFDESQSAGSMKFIQNDSLREHIFNYYRITKRNYDDENTVQSIYRDIYPIFFKKLIASKEYVLLSKGMASTLPGLDITALNKDQDYMSILFFKEISEKYQILSWQKFKLKAESLVQHIKSNLNDGDPQ